VLSWRHELIHWRGVYGPDTRLVGPDALVRGGERSSPGFFPAMCFALFESWDILTEFKIQLESDEHLIHAPRLRSFGDRCQPRHRQGNRA